MFSAFEWVLVVLERFQVDFERLLVVLTCFEWVLAALRVSSRLDGILSICF